MPAASSGKLHIRLSDETPIVRWPYRLAAAEREVVKQIIVELLGNNIISECESPYASPITLVKKKNGQHRMCVDFRALNNITVKDRYPIPRIDDQIDALAKAKWFCSLDMTSGFYQIPIAKDSIEKTGALWVSANAIWIGKCTGSFSNFYKQSSERLCGKNCSCLY